MSYQISPQSPLCLCILDGFGYTTQVKGNAIAATNTPTLDYLWSHYPHTLIKAAEEEVGLDFGQPGNSEVGHLSIGTGRVLLQHLARINLSINENSFYENSAFLKAIEHAKTHKSKLHIMGMISATGVHAHLDHMLELIHLASMHNLHQVYLHLITDGRDAGPQDGPIFVKKINQTIEKYHCGKIATLCGRETAMDRNKNWDLTEKYYNLLLGISQGQVSQTPLEAIDQYYAQNLDDEHLPPTLFDGSGLVSNNDALIFTNFREDRARQITQSLVVPTFLGFPRQKNLTDFLMVTMTQYESGLPVEIAYPPENTSNCLSDCIEAAGLSQFHIAESEKTAHVTYFFNGGRETTLTHEEHQTVKSYPPDQFVDHPEMSASAITDAAIEAITREKYAFIVVNYANADMIGHTGNFEAACQAVAIVDQEVNRLANAILRRNGVFSLTADHGNVELMSDPISGAISKEHTINPVPFILAAFPWHQAEAQTQKIGSNAEASGILADVAPTLLKIINLPIPEEMTGTPIFNL